MRKTSRRLKGDSMMMKRGCLIAAMLAAAATLLPSCEETPRGRDIPAGEGYKTALEALAEQQPSQLPPKPYEPGDNRHHVHD